MILPSRKRNNPENSTTNISRPVLTASREVILMGLTDKREELLKQLPIIQTEVRRSKDGKYLIHRTTITHIKPMSYYKAILDNTVTVEEESIKDLQTALEA
ncbi:hypothetical protein D6789_02605 [Candidatus Woesearchaeota archaeon]|nr:MAG: hypothetical protein D6789_02605 [Candidatus Woesearchaeota archaeon]